MVILLLALRIVVKWLRGDYRSGLHAPRGRAPGGGPPPPLPRAATPSIPTAGSAPRSRPSGSASCTASPGPAPSSLLLIAALPGKLEAAAALAVFAPMSVLSMTICTTGFAWLLTRRLVDPLFRTVLIPAFGLFGLLFGAWYIGIG